MIPAGDTLPDMRGCFRKAAVVNGFFIGRTPIPSLSGLHASWICASASPSSLKGIHSSISRAPKEL